RMRTPVAGAAIGTLRRVSISNVIIYDDGSNICSTITGLPGHDIEDLSFNDIRIVCQGGGTKEQAARELIEGEKAYPEPNMFGDTPAYGFFIRHATGIQMHNVAVTYMNEDARPPFVLD